MGIAPGVQYLRADHTSGPPSVQITVSAVRAGQGDQCCMSTCSPAGPGLTYLRRDDTHGYIHHRGDVIVSAEGGVSVDRQLLRRTALATRPATDAELLRALPAPPPRDRFDRYEAGCVPTPDVGKASTRVIGRGADALTDYTRRLTHRRPPVEQQHQDHP